MKTTKPENQAEVPSQVTVKEAGARGGRATLESQGTEFFKKIGKKGGERTKELYGELLSEFGRKGGRPRRPNLEDSAGEELPEKKGAKRLAPGRSPPA